MMRVFAAWHVPDQLRNELLQHLNEFESAHPGCLLEVFVQSTPAVSMAAFLRAPASSVMQVLERHGPSGPQLSKRQRAREAIHEHPGLGVRALARLIDVPHQTVVREKAKLRSATVQSRNHGPRGPLRGGSRL